MKEEVKDEVKEVKVTDEEVSKITEIFVKDRMKFVDEMPFYGLLLLELDPVATGIEIPTAAVNYKNLFLHALSPERCPKTKDDSGKEVPIGYCYANLSAQGRKTILAHEIGHLIFEHLSIPRDFNRDISNIAMDAVINRILAKDTTFSMDALPEGCVTPIKDYGGRSSGFTVGAGKNKKVFTIQDFDSKDWIPIYWDVMKQLEQEACKATGCSCKGSGKCNAGAEQRKKIAEAVGKAAKGLGDSNPMNGDAGKMAEDEIDANFDQKRTRFRQKVISVIESCKSRGTVPGEFSRLVDDLDNAKVHWTTYLRRLLKTEIARDDFSHKTNPRRAHITFGGQRRPAVFPKVESEALGDVFLALDTSGSMSEKDIREGLSEFKGLRQAVPFRLHFVSCDARAYEVTTYDRFEEPEWTSMPISGGGGTDFRPVFDLVENFRKEQGVRPALLVYFTDTMGSFPENEPSYPVIWVCNYPNGKVPWGTLVSTVD